MPKYSELPAVDEAFRRWVVEEDPPQESPQPEGSGRGFPSPGSSLYPPALARPALEAALAALEKDARVHPIVDATVEHSAVALAVKCTRLFPEGAPLLYAQLDVHLSRFGRAALLRWEWRKARSELEPTFGAAPPLPSPRAEALAAAAGKLLEDAGVPLVPLEEAERVVRVSDDPRYEGEYYEIKVFEALFGMGYPERQR